MTLALPTLCSSNGEEAYLFLLLWDGVEAGGGGVFDDGPGFASIFDSSSSN